MNLSRNNTLILAACAVAWVLVVIRIAQHEPVYEPREIVSARSDVQQYAREQLNALQRRSFSEGREFCGVIVENETGELSTMSVSEGDIASCQYEYNGQAGITPVASFHTHGGASIRYDDEAPSLQDLQSDISSRMDGYLATPGGRFWRIDWQSQTANLICGEGCLEQDPEYSPCPAHEPETQYDIKRLQKRFRDTPSRC
ncbi:DUF4329 domain-containing protein [Erythrobacter sp. THAF29]|uniref:DUF4329 domain-containing protein n=1 Tax=Erythrobacter sp. THAF29 TaxID=2587851 RepID=UPI00126959DE|nr:DUF4329 domain-containing protein [Erythrobacter sp. THAF29]QFT77767.1 hypothetical protein FIU90_09495 [Erythrobacter sp. THAF29]